MEIVNVEARTFETLTRRVEELCRRHESKKLEEWLDGPQVCRMLNVSKRTLQSLRSSGRLGYSQIGRMMYYKARDVERLIAAMAKEAERTEADRE